MLSKKYKITQLTADNDLIRVRLDSVGGESAVDNPDGLNAVVGLRETQITWAAKASEARGLSLGDTYTLTLSADVKGNRT